MRTMENQNGALSMQSARESTHILRRGGRSGCQQYFDSGLGRVKNVDFEPMHYRDT